MPVAGCGRFATVGGAQDPSGLLVLVVGPSGAGKDTIMRAVAGRLAGDAGIVFPRRVVTRASANAAEDCLLMTVTEFEATEAAGQFLLSWPAHGLHYGIPLAVETDLAAGRTVIINISRGSITTAEARVANTAVVHITASPDVLARRIAARARETIKEIATRLAREAPLPDSRSMVLEIRNEGTIDDAADRFCAFLAAR